MKRFGLAMLLLAAGCSSQTSRPWSQRQAVELPTTGATLAPSTEPYFSGFMDTPWPQLGVSLSACPEGGWVAGGGEFFAVYTVDANDVVGWHGTGETGISLGRSVSCVDDDHWVAGGSGGTYRSDDSTPVLHAPTFALARFGGGILAGAAYPDEPGCVYLLNDAGVTRLLCGDGGTFGQAIAINEDKPQLAIGSPGQDKVELFELDADGGLFFAHPVDPPSASLRGSGFGSALAYGDVAAAPGRELLVGSGAGVFIYNEAPHLVLRLDLPERVMNPVTDGPPFSIVVERVPLGNWPVRHFWLGLPSSDLVFRCLGTSCNTFSLDDPAVGGTRFGASLAIDRGTLLVGAPGWANGGAVFAFSADLGGAFDGGVLRECDEAGKDCGCGFDCLGGVLCLPLRDAVCGDAGVDAGETYDAGTKDAGVPDAGIIEADAGSPDAGPEELGAANFVAQGCTSTLTFQLLLLALLPLSRKRERVSRSEW